MNRYSPPQFNHRTDKGSGGYNIRTLSEDQQRLLAVWREYDSETLAAMLLIRCTLEEQEGFTRLYNATGYK